jgi:putative membrane protein
VPLLLAKITASVLILFAGFCLVAAVWRHLWRSVPPPPTDVRPIPRGTLVPINVFLLLVAAAALFGIWAA